MTADSMDAAQSVVRIFDAHRCTDKVQKRKPTPPSTPQTEILDYLLDDEGGRGTAAQRDSPAPLSLVSHDCSRTPLGTGVVGAQRAHVTRGIAGTTTTICATSHAHGHRPTVTCVHRSRVRVTDLPVAVLPRSQPHGPPLRPTHQCRARLSPTLTSDRHVRLYAWPRLEGMMHRRMP